MKNTNYIISSSAAASRQVAESFLRSFRALFALGDAAAAVDVLAGFARAAADAPPGLTWTRPKLRRAIRGEPAMLDIRQGAARSLFFYTFFHV